MNNLILKLLRIAIVFAFVACSPGKRPYAIENLSLLNRLLAGEIPSANAVQAVEVNLTSGEKYNISDVDSFFSGFRQVWRLRGPTDPIPIEGMRGDLGELKLALEDRDVNIRVKRYSKNVIELELRMTGSQSAVLMMISATNQKSTQSINLGNFNFFEWGSKK